MKQNLSHIIYGIHPINEIILAKKRKILYVWTIKNANHTIKSILKKIPSHTPIKEITKEQLNKISGNTEHQGIIIETSSFPFKKNFFTPEKYPIILLCDNIEDPRNLGALLRSAYCTNFTGIIISKKNTAPLEGASFKASAGLAEQLDIYLCNSSIEGALLAKKAGYNLYNAALGGEDIRKIEFKDPLCIVIGNEGQGIQQDILKLGSSFILPQKRSDISYNASVAGGISLFYISYILKI